ncbi:hypothetical protein FCI23_52635 [Actinacidiphila oryziradicis]|uniref:Uncharacterized protein n=1 Tax=Actinacidiphila oryziradicis TaxID=2571141 RepID=A0A4U0RJY3_9ACTN|nr:hypothetical protein FCI23_52635 [Actinacidiphila oryziradicis]
MTLENHTFDPFSEASPWEAAYREAEAERDAQKAARMSAKEAAATEVTDKPARAAGSRTEDSGANWENMTKRPMDWQRQMICLDISTPAKILGIAMSHYCGPNLDSSAGFGR